MKKILFVIILILSTTSSYAQWHLELPEGQTSPLKKKTTVVKEQPKPKPWFDKSKVTFGGGLGAQFGDYTVINIAPQIGYNFAKEFNAGFGFTYTHWSDKYYADSDRYKQTNNYFGFNLYAKAFPIQNIVIMAQPEINRVWRSVKNDRSDEKLFSDEKFVAACVVGAGLRLGPMTAMLQYDVVQNDDSPYGNGIFYSVGYTFGF